MILPFTALLPRGYTVVFNRIFGSTMKTIFLSSTSRDLEECRDAAYRSIEGLRGYHCVRMENFGSWDQSADKFCRAEVAKCDLFICIAGPCYGSRSPAGKSYTEREFDAAKKKPRLVFVTAKNFPLAADLIESDENRKLQAAFRKKVSKGRIVNQFKTAHDLSVQVLQAIRNWEDSQNRNTDPAQANLLASQIRYTSYRVSVLNRSTSVSDDEVRVAVGALQKQVHRDFAPIWGVDAEIKFVASGLEPEPKSWWLVIEDEPDPLYENSLGYHTLTSEGLPQVKISVSNTNLSGWPWSIMASHDLLEMLANPTCNLHVFSLKDEKISRFYRREICDPVRSPEFAYKIDGVVVSNFVYPAWFEWFRAQGSTKFDHCGHVSSPFECTAGAHLLVFDVYEGSWRNYTR